MGRIYPKNFPQDVAQDPRRRSEKRFYEVLRDFLPPEWIVFYSVPWTAPRGPNGFLRDGEADFIVVHPRRGWLALELKGGAVGLDSDTMSWWQDTSDGRKPIAPFDQARNAMHELAKTLLSVPRDAALMRRLAFGHGVVFPDAYIAPSDAANLPPYAPRETICDCTITPPQITAWLENLLTQFAGTTEPPLNREQGARVATLMQERFAPRLTLSMPLSVHLGMVEDRLLELTHQQSTVLQAMGVHRRLAVHGCAGSGKTMLAIEKARQLAGEGFQTLVVCRSSYLSEHLAKSIALVSVNDSKSSSRGIVTLRTYADLVHNVSRASDLPPLSPADSLDPDLVAERLLTALTCLGKFPYDAVLVDEGQDFTESEWVALSSLTNAETGVFYVFYDDNQRLQASASDGAPSSLTGDALPERLQLTRWPLIQNVRNSVPIFEAVKGLYDAPRGLFSYGPQGPAVSFVEAPNEVDIRNALRSRLHTLIYDERVPVERIVVLTPRPLAESALPDIWRHLSAPQNTTRHFDIATFKGLEASVVIVVELDALFEADPRRVELAYVGLSRARSQLILMGEAETLDALRNGLR